MNFYPYFITNAFIVKGIYSVIIRGILKTNLDFMTSSYAIPVCFFTRNIIWKDFVELLSTNFIPNSGFI